MTRLRAQSVIVPFVVSLCIWIAQCQNERMPFSDYDVRYGDRAIVTMKFPPEEHKKGQPVGVLLSQSFILKGRNDSKIDMTKPIFATSLKTLLPGLMEDGTDFLASEMRTDPMFAQETVTLYMNVGKEIKNVQLAGEMDYKDFFLPSDVMNSVDMSDETKAEVGNRMSQIKEFLVFMREFHLDSHTQREPQKQNTEWAHTETLGFRTFV